MYHIEVKNQLLLQSKSLYVKRISFKLNKNEMLMLIHSPSHNCFIIGFLLHPYKIRLET